MKLSFIITLVCVLSKSLSLRFPIYQYNHSFLIDPPGPPFCTNQQDHVKTISLPTTLWFVNTNKISSYGILIWTEYYQTSCFTNFWGTQSKIILQNYLISTEIPDPTRLNNWLYSVESEKVVPVTPLTEYECSWMTTKIKTSSVTFIKKVPIFYSSDGGLYSSSMEWITKVDNNTYQNDNYFLYGNFPKDHCPPLIKETYPSIIRIHENFYYITIPSLQIQFNLLANQTNVYCTMNKEPIYITPDNYLISIPHINITHIKLNQPLINTEYKWSKLLFDLNNVEEMIEEELQYLEHEICFNRKLIWNNIFYLQNPTLIAKYFTGNNWAQGQYLEEGKILVTLPSLIDSKCSLPVSRDIINNSMKVLCNSLGEVYVTPWTNSLNGDIYRDYGYWLYISPGMYINYQTGKVQITSKFNDLKSWQYKSFNVLDVMKYLQSQPSEKSLHKIVHIFESTSNLAWTWSSISNWFHHVELKLLWFMILLISTLFLIKLAIKKLCLCKSQRY